MRLYLRSRDRRPDPAPLVTDDRAAVLVGMGAWVVAWVVCLVGHGRLIDDGRGWWLWTPPIGIVLGLLGLLYLRGRPRREPEPREEPEPQQRSERDRLAE